MTYPQEYSFHDINLAWRRASLRGIGGRSSASRGYQKKKRYASTGPPSSFRRKPDDALPFAIPPRNSTSKRPGPIATDE